MPTIFQRSSSKGIVTYQVKVRLKGHPTQTQSFRRKTDAAQWARARETDLRRATHFPKVVELHTFAELVERYQRDILPLKPKNAKTQRAQLDWWKAQFSGRRLAEIKPADVAACRDRLLGSPMPSGKLRAPATAVRYLATLSHAYSVAVKEWGWVEDNPLRRVTKPKEPRGRVRFLDAGERERLLAACRDSRHESLYVIVVLAITTGMRRGEIMGLRWSDVDFEREQLTLHRTKNDERRVIPLVGQALILLRELSARPRVESGLVFPGRHQERPLEFNKAWERAVKCAALIDFRFHDLRHTAASYLAMQGGTTLEIAETLGHKTLQMVKRYAHLSPDHKRESLRKLDAMMFSGGAETARDSRQPPTQHSD